MGCGPGAKLTVAWISGHFWPDDLLEKAQDLARLGVATLHCILGEDQVAVDAELKRPLGPGDEGEALNDMLVVAENFIRHTDGTRGVVSGYAVFKRNGEGLVHGASRVRCPICRAEVYQPGTTGAS